MKTSLVTTEIAPKLEGGVDFGVEGRVLIRCDGFRLVWRPGHRFYRTRMEPQGYAPTSLTVYNDTRPDLYLYGVIIKEGGRLSKKLLLTLWPRIADLMPGLPCHPDLLPGPEQMHDSDLFVEILRYRQTLVVTPEPKGDWSLGDAITRANKEKERKRKARKR